MTKRHFLEKIASRQNNLYVQFVTSKLFRSIVTFYHLKKKQEQKMSRNGLLTTRPWAKRGSCSALDLLLLFFFVGDQMQTFTRPNRDWGFEIMQPVMFIRQKLLKH